MSRGRAGASRIEPRQVEQLEAAAQAQAPPPACGARPRSGPPTRRSGRRRGSARAFRLGLEAQPGRVAGRRSARVGSSASERSCRTRSSPRRRSSSRPGVDQLPGGAQRHGHRVDAEVAAREVRVDPAGRTSGSAPGYGYDSARARATSTVHPLDRDSRGAEPIVLAELAAERPGERQVVAGDGQVESGPLVPEQGVAHGAPDRLEAVGAPRGLTHRLKPGRPAIRPARPSCRSISSSGVIRALSFA